MRTRAHILGTLAFLAVLASAGVASANTFSDIPGDFADKMGVSEVAAGLIMSAAILLVGICVMAIFEADIFAQILMSIVIVGCMVVLGWMPFWVLLFAAILAAIFFAAPLSKKLGSGG